MQHPAVPESDRERPAGFRTLGVRVDPVQIPDVVQRMKQWIEERRSCRFIAVTGMHGLSLGARDERFRAILNDADLVVPDGTPLIFIGRRRGFALRRRVYGPELMEEFCRNSGERGYRHFFYGGAHGVAQQLTERLQSRYPGLRVAGVFEPPFRELTPEEKQEIRARINSASPDVLWVGLGTPKQEIWMHENGAHLRVPVMVGVGAAFDLLTGRVRQAPRWMREHGLEWSWRLMMEPRRLWRRYLIGGSRFVWNVGLEMAGLKRFD